VGVAWLSEKACSGTSPNEPTEMNVERGIRGEGMETSSTKPAARRRLGECGSIMFNPFSWAYVVVSVLASGWWFQPYPLKIDGVKVSWDDDIPNIWKNKNCTKPPTRHSCCVPFRWLDKYIDRNMQTFNHPCAPACA